MLLWKHETNNLSEDQRAKLIDGRFYDMGTPAVSVRLIFLKS